MTVDPTGRFVYVANGSREDVSAYAIDGTTGVLTPIDGSPFQTGPFPRSVAVDSTGRFAYVAALLEGIWAYTIDGTTGVLTPVAGSPFRAGFSPFSVTVDPTGRFAYVANAGSQDVSAYTIDRFTGALTPVAGSPFPAGSSPFSVTMDPTGRFVYAVNLDSHDVSAYTIDGISGEFTPLVGSPFPVGSFPWSVTTTAGPIRQFAQFGARAQIDLRPKAQDDRFAVEALFTLGAGHNGILPLTEPVTLAMGIHKWTIPPGSFQPARHGGFVFKGSIGRAKLAATIQPFPDGAIGFVAVGKRAELTSTENPVDVRLIIGNDGGTIAVVVKIR